MAEPVAPRLADLRDVALSVEEVMAAVADERAGGVAVFVGTVRDHDGGRSVTRLAYSAHPSALDRLREVVADVARDPDVIGAAVLHRVGDLAIGDLAVVVAVSSAHRGDAFAAARTLIDRVKAQVPIWKEQHFTDGGSEWVGAGG
jgi:molybdopterin synthase catalytic subunit